MTQTETAPGHDPTAHSAAFALLEAAKDAIAAEWRQRTDLPLLLDSDPGPELDAIVTCMRRSLESGEPPHVEPGPNPILRRRLADCLQLEILTRCSADGAAADAEIVLPLVVAAHAVSSRLNPEWGHDAAALLSSPDGLGLVAEVAHDLRSPLSAVLFLSDTLRRGHSGEVNDLQRRQLGLIYSATLALINVGSDIIELARGGHHLAEGEWRPFSVTQTLEAVRNIIEPMAAEKHVALRLRSVEPDRRVGHPLALNRILLNLATNAIKYTEEGFIEMVARADGRTGLHFTVRDTGPGIPEEEQQSLFMPFRTRPDRGYEFSGTGLGLSIARRLVQAMGGELAYETAADWGTAFRFRIDAPPAPSDLT